MCAVACRKPAVSPQSQHHEFFFFFLPGGAQQEQSVCQCVLRGWQRVRREREGRAQLPVHRGETLQASAAAEGCHRAVSLTHFFHSAFPELQAPQEVSMWQQREDLQEPL